MGVGRDVEGGDEAFGQAGQACRLGVLGELGEEVVVAGNGFGNGERGWFWGLFQAGTDVQF